MAISLAESDLRAFYKANPAQQFQYLQSVERVSFNPKTKLYQFDHTTSFNIYVNDNSRLFSKTFLSNSVSICDFFDGDVEKFMPKIIQAISITHSACIFVPSKSKTADKRKTVNKELLSLYKDFFPFTLKRSSIEVEYNNTIPLSLYVSPTNPYYDSFAEMVN